MKFANVIMKIQIDNIELYFDPKVDLRDEIKKSVLDAYEKNKLFFGHSLTNKLKVQILYSRQEMDSALGFKTESWVVGATPKGIIHIFSPKIFDKVSSHPVSNFDPVLTHEMAHIFTDELFRFYQPKWLHEGLAGHVAEQYKNMRPKKISDFEKLHTREDWGKEPNYAQASCFTAFLIEKFRKEQFLKFLKNLSENEEARKTFVAFTELFKNNFSTDFQKTSLEWQKSAIPTKNIGIALD